MELAELIERLEAETEAELSFALRDLQTGETRSHFPERKVKTASIIKLPMLVHVALAVEEGLLKWEMPLTLTEEEKVGGAGVLRGMTPGVTLSLKDICYLMTVISDNTATNMVIEFLGRDGVNARMRALGLSETTLFRKAYSQDTLESVAFGLGVTTAGEMVELVSKLALGKFGSPETRTEILRMLGDQFHTESIPRYLPADWKYAGKTGAIDAVRNDVGLVTAPDGRRFALAIFCQKLPRVQWTADNPGLLANAKLAHYLLMN